MKEVSGYGYRKMRREWEVVRVHTDGTDGNVLACTSWRHCKKRAQQFAFENSVEYLGRLK